MKRILVILIGWCFCYLLTECITPYEANLTISDEGILVVEGIILEDYNTEIKLSRTKSLVGSQKTEPVYGELNILCDNGSSYPMALKEETEKGGIYKITSPLRFDWNAKYALDIKIDGKHYQSDFVPPVRAPEIEKIIWSFDEDRRSAHFYLSTSDPENQVAYYQWRYEEDWEIISSVYSHLRWDPVDREAIPMDLYTSNNRYHCWAKGQSARLILGNAEKLSEYWITDMPVAEIKVDNNDWRFTHLYCLTVKQYGLTADAYAFFLNIQTNMEQTGELFGAQPSEMEGNIHCLDNPDEPVVGYVTASMETKKRVFITARELLGVEYLYGCSADADKFYSYENSQFAYYDQMGIKMEGTGGYIWVPIKCVDCTTLGGTKNKPDFWPNDHL